MRRICWNHTETPGLKLTLQLFRNGYHWSLLGLRGDTQKNNFYASYFPECSIRPLRTLNTLLWLCLINLTHTHFLDVMRSGFRRAQHTLNLQLGPQLLITSLLSRTPAAAFSEHIFHSTDTDIAALQR